MLVLSYGLSLGLRCKLKYVLRVVRCRVKKWIHGPNKDINTCVCVWFVWCFLQVRDDDDIKAENEVNLSFTFDMDNVFRSFPVGEYIRKLSGYRKLSLGVTIMVFIDVCYVLLVSGWLHILEVLQLLHSACDFLLMVNQLACYLVYL